MEIANSIVDIRVATKADNRAITDLLWAGRYRHVQVGWRQAVDWLGTPGFVVAETTQDAPAGAGKIRGCLIVAPDPWPVAWVRVAALQDELYAVPLLRAMLDATRPSLVESGVTQVAWLPTKGWPDTWVDKLGFARVKEIETFVKETLSIPAGWQRNDAVSIRPVRIGDISRLVAIEAAAFAPLWRHSQKELILGRNYAFSFDVAEVAGEVVGFQYSVLNEDDNRAHLVRMTVHPEAQGRGVGSALLVAAIRTYRRQEVRQVSLNTQVDNVAAQRLYKKFGFHPAGDTMTLWSLPLP